jgi:hypothetical protein
VAHEIQKRLMQNTNLTVHAIASQERVSANYVYRLLRLPTLAPDIITAIVNGKNPPQLTAKKLMRLANAGRLVTRDSMERSSSSSAGRHRPVSPCRRARASHQKIGGKVPAPRAPALPLSQYFASPPCPVLVSDLYARLGALLIFMVWHHLMPMPIG